jgi:hypothetical protein
MIHDGPPFRCGLPRPGVGARTTRPGFTAFRSDFGERTGRDTRGPQHYFTMRVDQEFLDDVEELRRLQTPIPPRPTPYGRP